MAVASLPIKRGLITSRYGDPRPPGPPHKGLDIAAPTGSPVLAILPGIVEQTYKTGDLARYGNVVVIRHGPRSFSLYAHLSAIFVSPGDTIAAGAPIGAVGNTAGTRSDPSATTSTPHLHLETLTRWPPADRYADRVNPEAILSAIRENQASFTIPPFKIRKRAAPIGLFFALAALYAVLKRA